MQDSNARGPVGVERQHGQAGSDDDLAAEVQRLRAEVAELRAFADDPMRIAEARSHTIVNTMYEFAGLIGLDGTVLEANRAALSAAQVSYESVIGQLFWDTPWWQEDPISQQRLREGIAEAAAGGFVRFEAEHFSNDDAKVPIIVDFSLKPVRDAAGFVRVLVAEGRNITERKRAELELARTTEEFRRLNEQLHLSDQLKTEFFANVSHELRTPLTLILEPIRVLIDEPGFSPAQRHDLTLIERNANTLLKYVNDLLAIARIDANELKPGYHDIDFAELVAQVATHFASFAERRQITFLLEVGPPLRAQVDPTYAQRILVNLLANAFKFTPDGGTVRCALTATADDALLIVEDSGTGVEADLREVIFERFRQGDGSTARRYGGTGLGLAIVRELAAAHGGSACVVDGPLGGARFEVRFPLHATDQASLIATDTLALDNSLIQQTIDSMGYLNSEVLPAQGAPPSHAPLVLLIEDHPEMRSFVERVLQHDCHVVSATNAAAGLELALRLRPDLIVSDVMMPDMGGDELVRAIRTYAELDGVPILLLTAKNDTAFRIQMLREGVQDYLMKPFAADELRVRVDNLVVLRRAREVLQHALDSSANNVATLASQLAHHTEELKTALVHRQRAEQVQEVRYAVTRLLNEQASFAALAPRLLEALCQGLGWDIGELWLVVPDLTLIQLSSAWYAPELSGSIFASKEPLFRKVGNDLPGLVWECGETLWFDKASTNPAFLRQAQAAAIGLHSVLAMPICDGTAVMGVVILFSRQPQQREEAVLELARDLGGRIGQNIRRKEAEESLQDTALQMQSLSARLIEAQEHERRQIARELHDEIGQSLSAAQISLQIALIHNQSAEVALRLEDSMALVDGVLQQVRTISLDLRPTPLDDLGLEAALRWYIGRHAERAGLAADIDMTLLTSRFSTELETTCFRVAQEAITNVLRHAGAQRLAVRLVESATTLDLSVKDDGQGFDLREAWERARSGGSLGVLGMQERAMLVGGTVEIFTAPGFGTEVRGRFPLPQAQGPHDPQGDARRSEIDPATSLDLSW